jgi:hypothetical protein
LVAVSGYQECEDQPLLELINGVADSAVPMRPHTRPAHCAARSACLQPACVTHVYGSGKTAACHGNA